MNPSVRPSRCFTNHLEKFHQIHNFGATGDKVGLSRFRGQRSRSLSHDQTRYDQKGGNIRVDGVPSSIALHYITEWILVRQVQKMPFGEICSSLVLLYLVVQVSRTHVNDGLMCYRRWTTTSICHTYTRHTWMTDRHRTFSQPGYLSYESLRGSVERRM